MSQVIQVDGNGALDVKLTPNPAKSNVLISSSDFFSRINIVDIQGVTVHSVGFNSVRSTSIDINSIPEGVYVVQIETAKGIQNERLIVL